MSEQIQTTHLDDQPYTGNYEHESSNESNKRRLLESLRARPEFISAMGAVALARSEVTLDTIGEHTGTLAQNAYNQAEKPKTIGDRFVARRLQKKLDKHAESIDEKLVGKRATKTFFKTVVSGRKISEKEAVERNNGLNDLRLKPKATVRAAKKAKQQAKKDFKKGKTPAQETVELTEEEKKEKERKKAINPSSETVYRSGTGFISGSAVEKARANRQAKAENLFRYGAKMTRKAGEASTESDIFNDNYEPSDYFDPAKILDLKREIKLETDRREIDAQVNEIQNPGSAETSRFIIEARVMDELLAKHFGLKSYEEVREKVPLWLEMTVFDMLLQPEEELEAMINGTEQPEETSDTPRTTAEPRREKPKSKYSFEPYEEDEDELDANSERAEVIDEEAETYEINELQNALNDLERINPGDPLYKDATEKLLRSLEKLSVENIYSGGTTIQGTDEVVGQTVSTHYYYEATASNGKVEKIPLEVETAKRMLTFKQEHLSQLANLETAEAGRIAYNINQRVSFRFSNETRDKDLTDQEKEDIRFSLFIDALADELHVDTDKLDDPSAVSQSLKKKVLDKLDKNEQERLERVEKMRAEEAAKSPLQRRLYEGSKALDELRNNIND